MSVRVCVCAHRVCVMYPGLRACMTAVFCCHYSFLVTFALPLFTFHPVFQSSHPVHLARERLRVRGYLGQQEGHVLPHLRTDVT